MTSTVRAIGYVDTRDILVSLLNRRTGFMMYMLRKVPKPTDSVEYEGMRFEVLDVDHYRIDQLLVKRVGHGAASPAFAASSSD